MFNVTISTIDKSAIVMKNITMVELHRILRVCLHTRKLEEARLCHRSFIQGKVGFFYYALSKRKHFYLIVEGGYGCGFREDLIP